MTRRRNPRPAPNAQDAIDALLKPKWNTPAAPAPPRAAPVAPPAPKHLASETRVWWSSVASDYALEPHHHRLLTLAGEAWDRCVQAREELARHGMTYSDRWGQPHPRPEVAIERDARIGFARLVRELNLDVDPPDERRPPRLA
jgi:phage terminase small subunit